MWSEDTTLDLFSVWSPFDLLSLDIRKGEYKRRAPRDANGGAVEPLVGKIGGIIGSESPDRHDEEWCVDGADVSDFLKFGWFNYEHEPGPDNVLGHPERVYKTVDANGKPAMGVEGVLYLGFKKAYDIWEAACAMRGTGRSFGFSVEGHTTQRLGGRKVLLKNGQWVTRGGRLLKTRVLNTAITRQPVNPWTRLDVLMKAHTAGVDLGGVPEDVDGFLTALHKASVGYQQSVDASGGLSALIPQSIDHGVSVATYGRNVLMGRRITKEELALVLAKAYPWLSYHQALDFAIRIVNGSQRA